MRPTCLILSDDMAKHKGFGSFLYLVRILASSLTGIEWSLYNSLTSLASFETFEGGPIARSLLTPLKLSNNAQVVNDFHVPYIHKCTPPHTNFVASVNKLKYPIYPTQDSS